MSPNPLNVAVLSGDWEHRDSEEHFVTRSVAAALAGVAEVHVLAATGTDASGGQRGALLPAERGGAMPKTASGAKTPASISREAREAAGSAGSYDGAMHLTPIWSEPPRKRRARILLESLTAGAQTRGCDIDGCVAQVPELTQRRLRALNGGSLDGALPVLERIRPVAVVLAGYRQVASRLDLRALNARFRTILLPLAGVDPQLGLPVYDDVFSQPHGVISVTRTEAYRIERRPSHRPGTRATPVTDIGLSLLVNREAAERRVPALEDTPYLVVLSRYPSETDAADELGLAHYVASRTTGHKVVVVHDDRVMTFEGSRRAGPDQCATRTDLLKLMSGAAATVDLRHREILAREVLESMLLGTPVVVREGSIGKEHAELGNGGLWFDTPMELLQCISALSDPDTREALSRQAQSYADGRYGRRSRFVSLVRDAVIGDSLATGGEALSGP